MMMNSTQENFEKLKSKEGEELGVSSWILIDQKIINNFADLTQDKQFIHVNPHRAEEETNFGGTIAHGFLILSMVSKFAIDVFPLESVGTVRINYGFNKIRFISPVREGSEIRGRFFLNRIEANNRNELKQIYDLSVEIKGAEKPAIIAQWILLTIYDQR